MTKSDRLLVATLIIATAIIPRIPWGAISNWAFTRIPPETPVGHTPRIRTWKNGIEQVNTDLHA